MECERYYKNAVKVTLHEVTEITRRVDVTIPKEEVCKELDRTYQTIGRKAKVKGFREGKVPRPVLEQYYRQEAEADAVRNLISQSCPAALQAAEVSPVAPPHISIKSFKSDGDLLYEAVVETKPVLEVKDYKGLSLSKQKTMAAEKEIEEGLRALQERSARLVPVLPPRKPRAGDVVAFDYEGFKEDKPLPGVTARSHQAELGRSQLIPEFEQGLMEMQPREKKRIEVTFPKDWHDKKLAGETIRYDVTLQGIKEKQLPELTDDFARDLGNFTALAEVKEKIREGILQEKEQREKGALARQAIEKLAVKNKFPVPEGMIEIELEAMLRQFAATLARQGLTLEQTGITPEGFFKENREEAKFRVMGSLLLEAIAKQEGIAVGAEEVEKRIEEMAKQAGESPDSWKRVTREKNLLPGVETALREEKTLDFVLANATIKVGT